ncbi:unnamed protein product [Sphenostylis stenocarpa]|uniref:Uncharacterized protein n=1 Tax=Sphenostylis stenocarpa TaxID=92480 RepID=A0AA86W3P5_9FABA|nr:unnamed protein product [Sphenostylis stenocarpa]
MLPRIHSTVPRKPARIHLQPCAPDPVQHNGSGQKNKRASSWDPKWKLARLKAKVCKRKKRQKMKVGTMRYEIRVSDLRYEISG